MNAAKKTHITIVIGQLLRTTNTTSVHYYRNNDHLEKKINHSCHTNRKDNIHIYVVLFEYTTPLENLCMYSFHSCVQI